MGLKDTILQVMDRDMLKCIVTDFELLDADRRSISSMRECVTHSHDATPESLLEYLYESQIKDVCALLSIDSTGRRVALVEMLLGLPSDSFSAVGNPVTPESKPRVSPACSRRRAVTDLDNPVRKASPGRETIR